MLGSYANILSSEDPGRTIVGPDRRTYHSRTYHSQTYYSTMIAVTICKVLEQSSELLVQVAHVRSHLVYLNYSISLETNPYVVASRLTVFG